MGDAVRKKHKVTKTRVQTGQSSAHPIKNMNLHDKYAACAPDVLAQTGQHVDGYYHGQNHFKLH